MATIGARIRALWLRSPEWFRSFVIDFVEAAVVAVIALNLAIPRTVEEATAQALIIITALSLPFVAAFRRHVLPAIFRALAYLFPRPGGE